MPQGVITALEVQKRNKERVNVFLDGEFAFSLNSVEAAKLRKGQILSEAEITTLRGSDAVVRAVDQAALFLSYRPRSKAEIRQNLAKKEVPPEVIEAALERLENLGYVDDHAFTQFWVENRSSFKPLSQRALRYELRQKGVPLSIINEVLQTVDDDSAAYQAAQERLRRLRGSSQQVFRVKLRDFLARRGFSSSVTSQVIAQIIEELETEQPDYFMGADADSDVD